MAAVLTAGITLTLPNEYEAETRLLLPESSGLGSLIETVIPGASSILGDQGGGYSRYLAILTSRTTFETVVDRFDLIERYDLTDDETPRSKAVRQLADNTTFDVSLDFDYLAVQVLDEDPEVAAQMANFFADELNRRNIRLSASSAAENREFLEVRLGEAEVALDSALAELQQFQEQSGVVEIEAQAEALMSALADAQGQVAAAEAQYRALRSQFGEENPDVAVAREVFRSARAQVGRLTGGSEAVMPVSIQQLPALSRRYALILAELKTQEAILEVVRPLYEQAVLTERQETDAVQVLDPAIPPDRKARPRRTLIVLAAAFSAGIFLCLLVLATAWVRQRGHVVSSRLRAAG
ncbi:MAG: lipopolysaccharide biosynthesis protein [Bacteroidota bacterium]